MKLRNIVRESIDSKSIKYLVMEVSKTQWYQLPVSKFRKKASDHFVSSLFTSTFLDLNWPLSYLILIEASKLVLFARKQTKRSAKIVNFNQESRNKKSSSNYFRKS